MEKTLFIIICFIAVMFQSCSQNHTTKKNTSLGIAYSFGSPYDIGEYEVRDTSFALPRKILDDPSTFMKVLTDVQMIHRYWSDTYDYPEELLFGDSILGKICEEVAASKGKPVFLIDNISDDENSCYDLHVRKSRDSTYTAYRLMGHGVWVSTWKMSELFKDLLDRWDKREMFLIGEEDEQEKRIVTRTGRVINTSDVIGRESGCITRLICNSDSVYVDMIKLYLWPFCDIPDEEEVMRIKEERLLRRQGKQI